MGAGGLLHHGIQKHTVVSLQTIRSFFFFDKTAGQADSYLGLVGRVVTMQPTVDLTLES